MKEVINFMSGTNFRVDPLTTMKMITASSVFGEASYYRAGIKDGKYKRHNLVNGTIIGDEYNGKTTTEIMEDCIDKALDYDFKETLEWAITLRKEFFMRLNPQVIMVRAAIHPKRKEFTQKYHDVFRKIERQVMLRADEPMTQLEYYINLHGTKSNMPSILKRGISDKLSSLSKKEVAKYKNKGMGMINAVRIAHAHSKVIDELMKTGSVEIDENENTWENLRSSGKSWQYTLNKIKIGHMAMLRNLRGIFEEIDDLELCKKVTEELKAGVKNGKQFPFRYYSALKAINNSNCNHKSILIEALEECIDIAVDNFPKLKGKTMCLSDNSGSAWGAITTEYGSVQIAEIDNLSSVIAACCSEEGYVGKFGDELQVYPVTKRRGILQQSQKISENKYYDVGGATEGGIWEFFKNAINNQEHWDNIFIFSDQQAGHAELYGTTTQEREYQKYSTSHGYINVFQLIQEYREKVNPFVNVHSVQTAGYDNVVIPENTYRTNILYGWTGKEIVYASMMNELWNQFEKQKAKLKI